MAQILYRRGIPGVLPAAWLIQPEVAVLAPPVVAVHGLKREAEVMARLLAVRADATGRTIVLPIFDRVSWPRFQRAACPQRSDWALLELLRVLRDEGRIGPGAPDLSGFSGGAQFAHRFAWLYPARVARLCVVAPGWWTFPDARGTHPLGVAGADGYRLRTNMARFLDRDIQVMVGALDTAQDENLRQDPDVMAQQGGNRVARARNWTAAALRAARGLGLPPRVRFALMENSAHSFGDCVANGALDQAFVPAPLRETETLPLRQQEQIEEVA
ncbi:MAG: alpha/beta hydrolase [Pseudomonadota bacterium]